MAQRLLPSYPAPCHRCYRIRSHPTALPASPTRRYWPVAGMTAGARDAKSQKKAEETELFLKRVIASSHAVQIMDGHAQEVDLPTHGSSVLQRNRSHAFAAQSVLRCQWRRRGGWRSIEIMESPPHCSSRRVRFGWVDPGGLPDDIRQAAARRPIALTAHTTTKIRR
jgi:hypothetical protein